MARNRKLTGRGYYFFPSFHILACLKWAFIVLVAMATVSEAVVCFQCSTTDPAGRCITDIEGMLNASKGIMLNASKGIKEVAREGLLSNVKEFVKDCMVSKPTGEWDRCFIERQYRDSNKLILFHRGCHRDMSNSSNQLLRNMAANNYTSCEMRKDGKNVLSCISFCQDTLCNGPQPVPEVDDECWTWNGTEYCGAVTFHGEKTPLLFMCVYVYVVVYLMTSAVGWW